MRGLFKLFRKTKTIAPLTVHLNGSSFAIGAGEAYEALARDRSRLIFTRDPDGSLKIESIEPSARRRVQA